MSGHRVLVSECLRPVPAWRHYLVVSDARVVIVEMTRALWGGWNVRGVTVQGAGDWGGYTAASIVAFKMDRPGLSEVSADSLGDFGARLLRIAAAGEVTP